MPARPAVFLRLFPLSAYPASPSCRDLPQTSPRLSPFPWLGRRYSPPRSPLTWPSSAFLGVTPVTGRDHICDLVSATSADRIDMLADQIPLPGVNPPNTAVRASVVVFMEFKFPLRLIVPNRCPKLIPILGREDEFDLVIRGHLWFLSGTQIRTRSIPVSSNRLAPFGLVEGCLRIL